jgi:hypothetical protein
MLVAVDLFVRRKNESLTHLKSAQRKLIAPAV